MTTEEQSMAAITARPVYAYTACETCKGRGNVHTTSSIYSQRCTDCAGFGIVTAGGKS